MRILCCVTTGAAPAVCGHTSNGVRTGDIPMRAAGASIQAGDVHM